MPKYLDLEGLKYYDQKLKDYINWESSYVVPEGGIPLTDLAEGVQQSLGKADTALQSSDIANSLSESDDSPVSASAVYNAIVDEEEVISAALNDLNSNKQNKLVSGTNIKTINNQSLLGEGNITISGGGSGDGGDGSDITEITEQNVEEAVNATAFIVVKIGIDPYFKGEINENEYGYGLDIYSGGHVPSRYYLFYAVINNNVVSLPISLLYHFTIKGKSIIGVKNYYKIANYNESESEDKQWRTVISLVNVNEKTFTLDEGNDKFSDAVYANSEIIPLGIELSNFPKFNKDDGNFIEPDFYNYRLVSNDFERKLKAFEDHDQTPCIDSDYIRSERFNNGLVGINNGITKSFLNINNHFISIITMFDAGIDFNENNSSEYFNFTTYDVQFKGYNIIGDYIASQQFRLSVYSTKSSYYDFDNWAITKDNIFDFINLMVNNKVIEDLGYARYEYYNFQLICSTLNIYDTRYKDYHFIDFQGNLLNITNSIGGYYFTLCGNTVEPSDSIYELVFINVDNETFANGELLFNPILIMWKKQENS